MALEDGTRSRDDSNQNNIGQLSNDTRNNISSTGRGWFFWRRNVVADAGSVGNSDLQTTDNNEGDEIDPQNTGARLADTVSTRQTNVEEGSSTGKVPSRKTVSAKRGWSFWNTQSEQEATVANTNDNPLEETTESGNEINKDSTTLTEPQILSINKNDKLIPNTFIPYKPADATLIKNASTNTDAVQEEPDVNLNQPPNIVVPTFDILPQRTIWSSIKQMFGSNSHPQRHLYRTNPHENFLELSSGESRPIKVLLIGVHGFFPTKMIRTFIGEPTGTSNRFLIEAEKVVLDYFNEKNIDVEISKIALEKEGEIFERVDFFYEVMKKWSQEIKESDIIYFVTHSQGCPVTIILLGKLMETGIINVHETNFFNDVEAGIDLTPRKKIISILGMAGINNGPFYGRDQTLLVKAYSTIAKDAMMELFEFQKYDSIQSKKLIQGLRTIISNNVKLTFIASINDQLVPLYSSFCLFAQHPNIFRATFIDKGSMTPSFITGIVNVAGKLLDLGFDDHNIIKEISPSLVGTLTGGGHSTIYNEYQVYLLGLKFALETTDTYGDVPVKYTPYKANDLRSNPYRLPWAMRGMLNETRRRFSDEEIYALYKEYEDWKPETPVLKDIKYRLNGLKYQL